MNLRSLRIYKIVFVVILVSCVNIVINFPAAEVKEAARKIEKDIRSGETAPAPESTPRQEESLPPRSEWRRPAVISVGVAEAEAAEVDLTVDSPTIRALTAARKGRYAQLKPHLDSGALGEGNNGLLIVPSAEGLDARARVQLNQLVSAENKDRRDLFAEFARVNRLADVGAVQTQFARAIRDEMASGQWYQDEGGQWAQKR
jgi:uncharacterized protein YdbL (DUF1318 family)